VSLPSLPTHGEVMSAVFLPGHRGPHGRVPPLHSGGRTVAITPTKDLLAKGQSHEPVVPPRNLDAFGGLFQMKAAILDPWFASDLPFD